MQYFLESLPIPLPEGVDLTQLLTTAAVFLAASLILGFLGKLVFGDRSALSHAVSSAIGILFIYVATVVVISVGGELEQFRPYLSPLPFVSIEGEELRLFVFEGSATQVICSQVLSMVILAFLVNLLDTVLPRGKNIITWFLFRCATIVLAILAHWLVTGLFTTMLPDVITEYASAVLLGILVVMLAVGALKFLVGAAIATVNPIIGALYTFFFANIVGRQLSKAVLTTALLSALVFALNRIGIIAISIAVASLMAYVPFLVILAVVWYILNRIL